MRTTSRYIILEVTPSGSFSVVFRAATMCSSRPGSTRSRARDGWAEDFVFISTAAQCATVITPLSPHFFVNSILQFNYPVQPRGKKV